MSTRTRQAGTVVTFDEHAGLGEVETSAARRQGAGVPPGRYGFHCTQIADGSRSIEVGTAVTFELRPGRSGRWEAADLRVQSPGPARS